MSIEETDHTAPVVETAPGLVPLLQTLGDAAAPVCVDGFCEVPGADATTDQPTDTRGADT